MKLPFTFLISMLIIASSCKKGTKEPVNAPEQPPVTVPETKPETTPYKYTKIQSFYTPIQNGQPVTAKRYLYTESIYDVNGNMTAFSNRQYPTGPDSSANTKFTRFYKYENNKRVEQADDWDRYICTYNSLGDTLEVKHYRVANSTLIEHYMYAYGTNGKKSTITYYSVSTGSPVERYTYTYNSENLLLSEQFAHLSQGEEIWHSVDYSYDSRKNIVKISSNIPSDNSGGSFSYVYNDKGLLVAHTSKYNTLLYPFEYVNTYDNDGLLIQQHFTFSTAVAIIDYVYTKR